MTTNSGLSFFNNPARPVFFPENRTLSYYKIKKKVVFIDIYTGLKIEKWKKTCTTLNKVTGIHCIILQMNYNNIQQDVARYVVLRIPPLVHL